MLKNLRIGLPNYWVNTATLNLVVQDTIFAYQGLGPAIILTLTYNASYKSRGMFGQGWRFSHESTIERIGEHILLWKGSGQTLSYSQGSPAIPQSPDQPIEAVSLDRGFDRLLDYGQFWLFVEKNTRLMYRHDKSPETSISRLTAISDFNGNTVQIRYSADGMIQTITDATGRSTIFSYDDNKRCVSFAIPDGRIATFSYDGQGNLNRVQDLLDVPSVYEYDADQYITRMIVGHDRKTTTFTYRNSGRRKYIGAVTDAGENTTRYEMVSANPRQVRVIDPKGRTTTYHSTNGLTEQIVDPLGNALLYSYARGLRVGVRSRNGQAFQMEYDTRGNITRYTDGIGNATTFVFDAFDNLISETNPLGETWGYTYDDKCNLTKITSPTGRVAAREYDPKGQLIAIIDPNGSKTTLAYDRFGNIAAITDPLGNITRFSHEPYGLAMTAVTDARGNTAQYEYDNNNRLTRVTNPDGSTIIHTYDCCTRVAMVNENGHKNMFLRNPMMTIKEWTDDNGNTSLFTYDRNNRLTGVIDALSHRMAFDYDDTGRLIQSTNPMGQTIRVKYDATGNIVSVRDERGMETVLVYDANNSLTRIIDPLGHSINFMWDPLRRRAGEGNARGGKVEFSYDADGRITSKSYDGVQFAAYEYDAASNLTKVTDATGTTTYKYDAANQEVDIRYPDSKEVSFSYDEAGNISAINYPGGLVVRYTYDSRNRVASIAWGQNFIAYRYDAVGNLTGESRSNGTESTYVYDANDYLIESKHQRGTDVFAHMLYSVDAMGNITTKSGILPLEPVLTRTNVVTTYNGANQIVTRGSDRHIYDADGNLTDISGGKWHAIYDPENRLVELSRNGQTTRYSYNGLGQRAKAVTGSRCRNFHHDPSDRLLFETDGSGQIIAVYIYHQSGLLVARVNAVGETNFYHYDKTGSTLALTNTNGETVAMYAYDSFGAVVNKSGLVDDNPFTYVGGFGVMDEDEGLFFMKHRYYDAATGRFIQKDPVGFDGGINLYAYVGNNPIAGIDPEGTCFCGMDFLIAGGIIIAFMAAGYYLGHRVKRTEPFGQATQLYQQPAPVRAEMASKLQKQSRYAGEEILLRTGDKALLVNPITSGVYSAGKAIHAASEGDCVKALRNAACAPPPPLGTLATAANEVYDAVQETKQAGSNKVGPDELYTYP